MIDNSQNPTLATRCNSLRERAAALAESAPKFGPVIEAVRISEEAAELLVDMAHRIEQLEK